MDAQTRTVLEIIGYYAVALLLSNIIARVLIGIITDWMVRVALHGRREGKYIFLATAIGSVEQFMYTASVLLGKPEFIGVWLVIKAVGEWRQETNTTEGQAPLPRDVIGVPRPYMIFLIGSGLSVIAGVGTALLMQQLLPAFPSLQHWQIPLM